MDDEDLSKDLLPSGDDTVSKPMAYVVRQLTTEDPVLDLSNQKLGDGFVSQMINAFADNGAHSLRQLDLSGMDISDQGVEALCEALIMG